MESTPARIPSKDYAAQLAEIWPELLPEIERVLREDSPILGKSVEAFEKEFARHAGTPHAVGVGSGTDAIYLALRGLGIGRGDEVLVPANTFIATVSAVVLAGARPVLVDPDEGTMNLGIAGARAAVTPATSAILTVHLYGLLSPVEELEALARGRGLALVEDSAQCHGARSADGRRAGAFGAAGCFSFHPSKNLGAFGDGGLVTTGDAALAERVRRLRNLGKVNKYEVASISGNSKLDTIQAAILRVKLRHLDGWNRARRRLAALYRDRLAGVGDLRLPAAPEGERHVYHLYVVRTARRDALRAHLLERGIGAGIHYPIPPHRQRLDVDLGYPEGSLPVTERLANEVLSLPISHETTEAQVELVCEAVRDFFGNRP